MKKTNEKEVAIRSYNIDKPAEIVKMATTLKEYVVKQQLYTNIKGKNYAHVEGWQFAGFLSGLNAIVESEENLSNENEIKWKVVVNVYKNDKLVSRGVAICSSKETTKKSFDEYAILSMAQTRAIGKAYRNLIGWVMKLAGYEATPSEEMGKMGESPSIVPTSDKPEVIKSEITGLLKKLGFKGGDTKAEIKRLTGMEPTSKIEDMVEIRDRLQIVLSERA